MRDKFLFLIVLVCTSCAEDPFPRGLYDYQVERLLSGGESKTWLLVSMNDNGTITQPTICTDSLRLQVSVINTDSIQVQLLTPLADCNGFSSKNLGNANASGDLVFTDSIIFKSGAIWIVNDITSKNLIYSTEGVISSWVTIN